jgi:hypothetical protein
LIIATIENVLFMNALTGIYFIHFVAMVQIILDVIVSRGFLLFMAVFSFANGAMEIFGRSLLYHMHNFG